MVDAGKPEWFIRRVSGDMAGNLRALSKRRNQVKKPKLVSANPILGARGHLVQRHAFNDILTKPRPNQRRADLPLGSFEETHAAIVDGRNKKAGQKHGRKLRMQRAIGREILQFPKGKQTLIGWTDALSPSA